MMLKVRKVLSHLLIILGGMFLTFFWIDRVNPAMCFIDNEISKWLLLCFSLIALALAIITLAAIHRLELREKNKAQKREESDVSVSRLL
jgi:membrane protein implicated in regulation of membrane protease activity